MVNSGFDPITSGLAMEAGDCDIAAASITITEEREENIDFSEGYFSGDQSLLADSGSGIASLADLSGKNLGVQTGTTGEQYANENASGATSSRSRTRATSSRHSTPESSTRCCRTS